MPDDTLNLDRPTVTFSDEDAPGALTAQPEVTAGGENGAMTAATVSVEAAAHESTKLDLPADANPEEAALAEAGAAAASMVGAGAVAAGGGSVSGGAVAAAAAAQGGGGARTAGAAFKLTENVGLAVTTFERSRSRPANRALLNLFVKEDHLLALWTEIGRVELEVVELRKGSARVVRELFDRLSMARNLLLADKDQYEDVLQQVNIVKHRLQRVRNSNVAQQPFTIQLFLYALVALLAWLFMQGGRITELLGNPETVVGIPTTALWNSVLWGGIGGLSAAFYALTRHVEDFEYDHARWYYLSPLIGLFFGPLVALLADVGLPAFVQLVGDASSDMQVRPAVMYLLAWAVGFKQNLLLELINSILGRILPGLKPDEEKDAKKP